MDKLLVSACLLGTPCRYDGKSKADARVLALAERYELIPVCPEQLGGLPTPRHPAERVGDKLISDVGTDVTEEYTRGADLVVEIAEKNNVDYCIMKANSPACGKGIIYDGTFTGKKCPGNGLATEKLLKAGFTVYTEDEI